MTAKFRKVLFVFASMGVFFLALGGPSSAVNPLPNFLNRLVGGDSDIESAELEKLECVEEIFDFFPERTVFRLDIADPYFLQRVTEIGFPKMYFDTFSAQYSLSIEQRPPGSTALLTFSCPDFHVVIDDLG